MINSFYISIFIVLCDVRIFGLSLELSNKSSNLHNGFVLKDKFLDDFQLRISIRNGEGAALEQRAHVRQHVGPRLYERKHGLKFIFQQLGATFLLEFCLLHNLRQVFDLMLQVELFALYN